MSDLIVRAKVSLSSGAVEFKGSPEAVSVAIKRLDSDSAAPAPRGSLKSAISALMASDFFDHARTLAEIKSELHARRVQYSPASLYPVLYKSFLKTGAIGHQGTRGAFKYFVNGGKSP